MKDMKKIAIVLNMDISLPFVGQVLSAAPLTTT